MQNYEVIDDSKQHPDESSTTTTESIISQDDKSLINTKNKTTNEENPNNTQQREKELTSDRNDNLINIIDLDINEKLQKCQKLNEADKIDYKQFQNSDEKKIQKNQSLPKKQKEPIEIQMSRLASQLDLLAEKTLPKNKMLTHLSLANLLLGIMMTILGGLVVAKGCSLAALGGGVWSGVLAAATGTVGVLWASSNSMKGLTVFLVLCLISFAASTLALALTCIGMTRDYAKLLEDLVTTAPLWSAGGLVFITILHCIFSLWAAYHTAISIRVERAKIKMYHPRDIEKLKYFLTNQMTVTGPDHLNVLKIPDLVNCSNGNTRSIRNYDYINKSGRMSMLPPDAYKIPAMNTLSSLPTLHKGQNYFVGDDKIRRTTSQFMVGSDGSPISSLNSKDQLVSLWLGRQTKQQTMQRPILLVPAGVGDHRGAPPMLDLKVRHQHQHPMYPVMAPIPARREHDGRIYGNWPMEEPKVYPEHGHSNSGSHMTTKSHRSSERNRSPKSKPLKPKKVDLTYKGLDRAMADEFIKKYTKTTTETETEDVQV